MKQLLIGKDVNYGASKSVATAQAATSPELLADGAIGIFGIDDTAANGNDGKLALITLATDNAGRIGVANFKGKQIVIAQGTSDGVFLSNYINIEDIDYARGREYAAPVMQVSYIGFDGTSGSLTLDSFLDRDEGSIGVTVTTLSTQQFPKQNWSTGRIYANSSVYDVVGSVAQKAYNDQNAVVTVGVVSNGTRTALPAAATGTQGSQEVTSTGHGLVVGDLVRLDGETYKVIQVNGANAFVVDRGYHGASGTIPAGTSGKLANAEEFGFKLTAKEVGTYFETGVQGIFERANQTTPVGADLGSGSGPQVVALEKNRLAYAGWHDRLDTRVKFPVLHANAGTNYDLFFIQAFNSVENRAEMGQFNAVKLNVGVALPNDMAGSNKSSFQTILTGLYPATVGI
jgi:hypothetical protein